MLAEGAVEGQLVADGVAARPSDDHGLGPASDLALHLGAEMLEHDRNLLSDRVRVQLDERLEKVLGLVLVVAGVVLDRLQEAPVGLVGGVALQHVEDETLLDSLPHAVKVERLELAVLTLPAEQLQGLGLRRSGEGEEGEVLEAPPGLHLGHDLALQFLFRGLSIRLFLLRFFQGACGQDRFQAFRALPRL